MSKEQLQDILYKVWVGDWSADDGSSVIWGRTFDGCTSYNTELAQIKDQWKKDIDFYRERIEKLKKELEKAKEGGDEIGMWPGV